MMPAMELERTLARNQSLPTGSRLVNACPSLGLWIVPRCAQVEAVHRDGLIGVAGGPAAGTTNPGSSSQQNRDSEADLPG